MGADMNSINNKEDNRAAHKLMLDGRKHLEINGVREVISFDELGVTLKTALGELNIEGRELTVTTLDTERGVVVVDGKVDGIYYSDGEDGKKRGIFGRLSK